MFVDIRKLTRQQVKEVLEAAGWAWDDAKSIDGERNRRDCEALVNEAYRRGFKAGINAKTQEDGGIRTLTACSTVVAHAPKCLICNAGPAPVTTKKHWCWRKWGKFGE